MAVAYTIQYDEINGGSGRREVQALVAFTAESYSAGLPIAKAKMGLPTVMESFQIVSATPGDTDQYKYDPATEKVRIYEEVADAYVEVSGNQTVSIVVKAIGW